MFFPRPVLQPVVNAAVTTIRRNQEGTRCLAFERMDNEIRRLAASADKSEQGGGVEAMVRLASAMNAAAVSDLYADNAESVQECFGYFGVDEDDLQGLSSYRQTDEETKSDLARAQDLMYRAWAATGTARIELARQAMALSDDCVDAYVLLAQDSAVTIEEARVLLETAVKKGEAHVTSTAGGESSEHTAVDETRPYLRAKSTLAGTLWFAGEKERAIQLLQEVLVHDPRDSYGARFQLVNWLLLENRLSDCERLLNWYRHDVAPAWVYSRALLLFKQDRQPGADRALRRAFELNEHVSVYLLGEEALPQVMPASAEPGEESEAIEYAVLAQEAWRQTDEALDWLLDFDKDLRIRKNLPVTRHWSEALEAADRFEEAEKYPKAYGKLRQALALAEKIGDDEFLVDTLYRLCDVCLELEAEAEDEGFFRELLDLVDRQHGDEHPAYSAALQRLGEFLANLGNHTEARKYLELAVEDMEGEAEFRELLNETLAILSEVYRALGEHEKAEICERDQDQLQIELEMEQLFAPNQEG